MEGHSDINMRPAVFIQDDSFGRQTTVHQPFWYGVPTQMYLICFDKQITDNLKYAYKL